MKAYTVRKPGADSDREFQAYVGLLQEIGIDVADAPRVRRSDSGRWLYVWQDRPLAERFASELGRRLRDGSWSVHELHSPELLSRGPLAPLVVYQIETSAGDEFRLEPASLERILAHYPNANPAASILWPTEKRTDFERLHGSIWDELMVPLAGIGKDQIDQMGGFRVMTPGGAVVYERPAPDARVSRG